MSKSTDVSHAEGKTPAISEDSRIEARRNFLKTAGKFALYTPPVVTLLMHPSTQAIANSGVGYGVGGTPPSQGITPPPFRNR